MKYESLWVVPSVNDSANSTENIIDLMRQQAQHLKTITGGKVLGKFSKLKNIMANVAGIVAAISTEISEDNEISNLSDANDLYKTQKYGFEIYNQSYKFRIFEMNLSPLYPISIYFDEGVLEDTKEDLKYHADKGSVDTHFVVKSDEELIESLRIVFSSKKVQYILYRLQQ